MKNKLVRLFIYFISLMFLFLFAFAIWGPKGKKIDLASVNFSTTSSSELYFKNIRSYFYDKEEREDANFLLYRIDSREKDSSKNKLSFLLVSNWLQNESYIMVEGFKPDSRLAFQYEGIKDTLRLLGEDSYSNYVFAAKLFERLEKSATITFLSESRSIPFTEREKISLHTTLKDYFKLVGKIR